jgi:cardiolipin synthase
LVVGADRIRLLRDGSETYPAMLDAIARAQSEVLLEMYWFGGDRTGQRFLCALVERCRAGVRVRIAYDAVGSLGEPSSMWEPLERAGGEIREYGPVRPWHVRFRWDRIERRDHRKMLVVDGEIGFTGGINIGDPWSPHAQGGQHWRDDAVEVRGPVVAEMRAIFYESFKRSGGATPPDVIRLPTRPSSPVALLLDRHGRARGIGHAYARGIRCAKSRIDIANPYFLPGALLLSSLRRAAKRGVQIRILVPGKNDVWLVSIAMESVILRLLRHGVRVFAYQTRVMHMKTAVFDATMATVGTYNLDPRSRRFNRECNVAVHDAAFAREVRESFERDLSESVELTTDTFGKRPLSHRLVAWLAHPLRQFL